MLTDFQKDFTAALSNKFAARLHYSYTF